MPRPLRVDLSAVDHKADYFALGGRTAGVYARIAQVQRIVRLVTEGTSVEVTGGRWSGRTELLRRVHQALRSVGVTIVTIRGISNGLPFEAVRSALPRGTSTAGGDTLGATGLIHSLSQAISEGPAVVLLDDGDLLDDASWFVLESAHKRTGVPIVAVALERASLEPTDHMLIKIAHPVVKISLRNLKIDTLHELLEDRLGGAVAPSLSGRIHTKSGGNPGFALAIVDAALAHGQLRKTREVWRDVATLWSDDLNGAYEALLFSYPKELREALELLALAGPVGVSDAGQLVGQNQVEQLEGNGLVRLFITGERAFISVDPPGIGDYFKRQPLTAHRLRLLNALESTLGQRVLAPPAISSDSGALLPAVSHQELPLVARMFSEQHKTELTLSWSEWERTHDLTSAVRVLEAHLTGDPDSTQLGQVVEHIDLKDADPMLELRFRYLHARWLQTTGAPFSEVEDALRFRPDFMHSAGARALLAGFRIERYGVPANYEEVFEPLVCAEGVDGDIARVVLAAVRALSGEGISACEIVEEVATDCLTAVAGMARGLALFATGKHAEAVEWATSQLQVAISETDRPALVWHSYFAALSLLAMGRYDDAAEAGHIVTSAGVSAGSLLFAPDKALLLTLALAATRTGRPLAAEGMRERAERYHGRSDALPAGAVATLEATVIAAEGELQTAAEKYREVVTDLSGRGFTLAADGVELVAILTEYDRQSAVLLRPRAERIGGLLFVTYLDARDAIHRKDPEALRAAAQTLRSLNATDEALKHLTFAATLFRDRDMLESAAEVRAEIREMMSTGDLVRESVVTRAESTWGLTSREREIIDDIAAGSSNAEIANRHGISVRTIETHIRNIRRKTGALSREEVSTFAQHRGGV